MKNTIDILTAQAEELTRQIDELRLARMNTFEALREAEIEFATKHTEAYEHDVLRKA